MTSLIGALHFCSVREYHVLALGIHTRTGHVIQAQDNVLRRHDDRLAAGRGQDVVSRHHQRTRFELSFQRQRYVDSHLVTVEVGVIGRTNERVQLNRLTFNQHRLERLDAQTVKCRCTVQQYWVFADYVSEDIPHFRSFALNHLLGCFDCSS